MVANVNSPTGLNPRRHARGGVVRSNAYAIVGGLASNIYRGSGVKAVNTSKRIDVAAAGDRLIGVFKGCSYVDSAGAVQFRPNWVTATAVATGTVVEAQVFDDPDLLFGIQTSSASGLVAADIGTFGDLVIGTGSTLTGNSGDMLDQTTLTATTATGGQLRVEALDPIEGNAYGQYAKALVRINEHQFGSGTTAGMNSNAV